MTSALIALIAQGLLSPVTRNLRRFLIENSRKWTGQSHHVIFFYQVDDPYSHLLCQLLPDFLQKYPVQLDIRVMPSSSKPQYQLAYSLKDACLLTQYFELSFPKNAKYPGFEAIQCAQSVLLACQNSQTFLQIEPQVAQAFWQGNIDLLSSFTSLSIEQMAQLLENNQQQLDKMGHYQGGMLYYGGEWYWGVDRLHYLEKRLQTLGLGMNEPPLLDKRLSSPQKTSDRVLNIYFSFRSPYSYLALYRLKKWVKQYPITLNIKPIWPMVTRGLPVPSAKKWYILRDAKRESERQYIPFGKICDPLGAGVERCMAIYPYAVAQGKALDFLLSIGTGIWAESRNVAHDRHLQPLVERAELSWETAKQYLQQPETTFAAHNAIELKNLGLWGVPAFQLDDTIVWGQDRMDLLEIQLQQMLNA